MDNKLTVILPVYRLNEEEKNYLTKALNSVSDQKVLPNKLLIVVPTNNTEVKTYLDNYEYNDILKSIVEVVENDGETDFCSQINYGVSKTTTEWFSILELDDEYSKILFDNFNDPLLLRSSIAWYQDSVNNSLTGSYLEKKYRLW